MTCVDPCEGSLEASAPTSPIVPGESAVAYLSRHGLHWIVDQLVRDVLSERPPPAEVEGWMFRWLMERHRQLCAERHESISPMRGQFPVLGSADDDGPDPQWTDHEPPVSSFPLLATTSRAPLPALPAALAGADAMFSDRSGPMSGDPNGATTGDAFSVAASRGSWRQASSMTSDLTLNPRGAGANAREREGDVDGFGTPPPSTLPPAQ